MSVNRFRQTKTSTQMGAVDFSSNTWIIKVLPCSLHQFLSNVGSNAQRLTDFSIDPLSSLAFSRYHRATKQATKEIETPRPSVTALHTGNLGVSSPQTPAFRPILTDGLVFSGSGDLGFSGYLERDIEVRKRVSYAERGCAIGISP